MDSLPELIPGLGSITPFVAIAVGVTVEVVKKSPVTSGWYRLAALVIGAVYELLGAFVVINPMTMQAAAAAVLTGIAVGGLVALGYWAVKSMATGTTRTGGDR